MARFCTIAIYFYSINSEQGQPQSFVIDWMMPNTPIATGTFVPMGEGFDRADYFFELGFDSGFLLAMLQNPAKSEA